MYYWSKVTSQLLMFVQQTMKGIEVMKVEVKIPNREIKLKFGEKLKLFYQQVYHIDFDILKDCSSAFDQFSFSNEENKK